MTSTSSKADHGKEEIEDFLDGERPEDVPVSGQIAAGGLEPAYVKGQSGEERVGEAADLV
jgi:hypothetical protein